ncbi:2780_t:CDS:2, partial [Funneliformis mosseae]
MGDSQSLELREMDAINLSIWSEKDFLALKDTLNQFIDSTKFSQKNFIVIFGLLGKYCLNRVRDSNYAMYESHYVNMTLNFGNSDLVIDGNT